MTDAQSELPSGAISAIRAGNKIEAIKIVRAARNCELKDAKDAVDAYVRGRPDLQMSLDAAQAETKRSALVWLAAIALAAFGAWYFLSAR